MPQLSKGGNRRLGRSVAAAAVFAAVSAAGVSTSLAATKTWDPVSGNGVINNGSGTWNTSLSNWTTTGGSTSTTWSPNDVAVFGGGADAAGTVNLGAAQTVDGITFNSVGSGNFSLTGNTITFNQSGSILQNSSSAASIATIFGNKITITLDNENTGAVTINNTVGDTGSGSNVLTFNKAGTGTFIFGSGGSLAHFGDTNISAGTLTLNGALTHSTVNVATAGTLNGTGTAIDVTLTAGGIINFGAGATIGGTLGVTGGNWNGAGSVTGLVTASGTANTFTVGSAGNLTANGGLTIASGQLAAAAASSIVTGTVNYNSGQNSTWDGVIAGSGKTLNVGGAGTLRLTGSSSNYTGNTNVTSGTLTLASGAKVQAASTVAVSGGTLSGAGSVLGNATISSGAINFASGGNIAGNLTVTGGAWNGLGSVTGNVNHTGGTFTIGSSGNLTVTAPSLYTNSGGTLTAAASTSTITGSISYGGTITSQTWAGNFAGTSSTLTFNRAANTLTLSGANTFGGDTRIVAGSIQLNNTNALQNSTVDMNSADAGTLTFTGMTAANIAGLKGSRNIVLQNTTPAAVTLTVGNATNVTTYSGILGGSGSLVKNGGGSSLTLTGANNYSGSTTAHTGTLFIGTGGSLTSTTVTVDSTGTLGVIGSLATGTNLADAGIADITNATQTIATLTGAGTLTLNPTILSVSGTSTFGGSINGTGGITKITGGNLLLNGASTFTGETKPAAGAITVGNTNALQSSTVNLATGDTGTLNFNTFITAANIGGLTGSRTLALTNNAAGNVALTVGTATGVTTYSGALTGGGSLTKNGGGALTLSGASNYSGSTTAHTGALNITGSIVSTTIGVDSTGTLNVSGSISSSANLTVAGTVNFTNVSQTVSTIAGAGAINLNNTAFNVANASSFAGAIGSGGSLTKNTSGTLQLTGPSTYTGDTSVSAGTLRMDGSLASGAGSFTIVGTGTLEGTNGTINRTVDMNSGGTVSPGGNGPSSAIAVDNLNLNGGSTYIVNITDSLNPGTSAGIGYDTLTVANTLAVNATGVGSDVVTIKLISGAVTHWNEWTGNQFFTIATSNTLTSFNASKFVLDVSIFQQNNATRPNYSWQVQQSGNDIRIAYVPEPGSAMMLSAAALIAAGRRRRRV